MYYNMGNAVLMPQFYGIGIRRASSNSLVYDNNKQPTEVRRLNFRSTYDSESGSSLFSDLKQSQVLQQHTYSKGQQNAMKNTQQSITVKPYHSKRKITRPGDEDLSLELYTAKKQKNNEQQGEQAQNVNDRSLINILTQIQHTQSERQAIRQKCSVLYQMGKYAWKNGWIKQTINYFEDVLRQSAASFPQSVEEKAKMLSMLGNCYFRLQNYQQSKQKYTQALQLLIVNEQNRSKCADIHMILGTISQKTKQFQTAIQHFNMAYKLKKTPQSNSSIDLLAPLSHIALNQIYRGNHLKAVEKYCQTLKINHQIYGDRHIEIARNYYNLALSLFAVGEYSSWLQYHFQSLKMLKELKLQSQPEYGFWLKWFKLKMRQLMKVQSYAQDVVGRSISMMSIFLDEDEQIQFLSGIKQDIQGSLVQSGSV